MAPECGNPITDCLGATSLRRISSLAAKGDTPKEVVQGIDVVISHLREFLFNYQETRRELTGGNESRALKKPPSLYCPDVTSFNARRRGRPRKQIT